jgi:hypothetical protein
MDKQFKKCPKCDFVWDRREDFLGDENLTVIGYEISDCGLVNGLFLFNHDCGTTMALKVEKFQDLYDGPVFKERLAGTDECPDYCLYKSNLTRCSLQCECAYVREILQILRRLPENDIKDRV